MKNENSAKKLIQHMIKGRATRICTVAVTVFLCILTLVEFTALQLEWEIPVLQMIDGEDTFWIREYQGEEKLLDDSTENVLLEESRLIDEQSVEHKMEQGETENIEIESTETPNMGTPNMGTPNTGAITIDGTKIAETGNQEDTESEDAEAEDELPYYIKVNRKQNCITVYTQDDEGEYTIPYKAMICSTGLYNATPRGTFQLSTKYLWRELYGNVYGQYATRIHGGVLFHSVPYRRKAKDSLCTDKYNKLGQQASMGCIRLTVEDAKWIAENCPAGTYVEIYDDDDPGPLGKPQSLKIDADNSNKGWDPTDPDLDNPWHELSKDE